ncbi:hypothetical protein ES708_31730 [subsurface metagenome]
MVKRDIEYNTKKFKNKYPSYFLYFLIPRRIKNIKKAYKEE